MHQVELETQNEQLRRVQAELESARDAAQQASRAKSAFLANMSHEIRTPVSGIVGMLQLLGATPLEDGQRRYATLAATCAGELLRLIDDILDFSKVEAGKLEFESAVFCPSSVVEESLSVLEPAAQAKGLGLSCRIAAGIPPLLLGDPHRLRQVLVNLIGNAVKFTHQGRVTVVAEARPARVGHSVLDISVVDTGIGIPARRRDRLFHNFSQVDDSTARAYGGTGLGLAISRQLVERMGGAV
ncbi:MAG: hybrid sensor histidine kinase/response regulator, partial [Proteobacteria bacterium]|nr:hybrid sensor histidine kinase/response regulator [Pseudomonadota bacterium]